MNTTYLAERTRNIAGYKVNTVFEVYEDTKGAICIEFETIGEDNMPLDNTTQGAGFSIKDIRSIFRGIKIMMRKANEQGHTSFCFCATDAKRHSLYTRLIKQIDGEITSNEYGEYVTFEAIV